eukprot:gb/GFBE01031996.1/.p1 GENE.gb/GFBE01031996.1/~~gb/GFBE01031996.1/.p1  ORF type:complete len:265 (+),score=38.21 gb/GFBE01031996.1/:1-795(+)
MAQALLQASRQWRHHIRREQLCVKEQWQQYLGLCGIWQGTWQRFAADADGKLTPKDQFCAVCAPVPADDGESVHHTNRYPEASRPPGREAHLREDGLFEVDFGRFDKASFQFPFGPHSVAVYGPGCAVMAPAVLRTGQGVVALELISVARSRRQRLVALWRSHEESASVAALDSVTAISEALSESGTSQTAEQATGQELNSDEEGLYQFGGERGFQAILPRRLPLGPAAKADVGLSWQPAEQDARAGVVAVFSNGEISEIRTSG